MAIHPAARGISRSECVVGTYPASTPRGAPGFLPWAHLDLGRARREWPRAAPFATAGPGAPGGWSARPASTARGQRRRGMP